MKRVEIQWEMSGCDWCSQRGAAVPTTTPNPRYKPMLCEYCQGQLWRMTEGKYGVFDARICIFKGEDVKMIPRTDEIPEGWTRCDGLHVTIKK